MERFIIKVNSIATEKNDNFKGQRHQYFYGKRSVDVSDFNHDANLIGKPIDWLVREYGFTTKSAALKALASRRNVDDFENNLGYWNTTSEIVVVDV